METVCLVIVALAGVLGAASAGAQTVAPLDPEVAGLPNAAASFVPDTVYEDGQIYVLEAGRARSSLPPLFLVHGLGHAGVRDYYRILPRLAEKRRVVAFDLPGFGRSTPGNRPYGPGLYAQVLARMIERYATGPVD